MKKLLLFGLLAVAPAVSRADTTWQPPFPINAANVPSGPLSSIPTCNALASGQLYIVTDALLPVLGSLLTGGGSVSVVVKCNGAGSWLAF